jgi:HAD superfamily hydrolase (TIGR01484 family)
MKASLLILAAAQRARGDVPFAIFTDLDGTFVSNGTRHISDDVVAAAAKCDYPLIAMTGRESARVLAEIDRGELPMFSAIIAAVGTEIWVLHGREYQPDEKYRKKIAASYDKPAVLVLAQTIVRAAAPALKLHFQEKKEPEPFKVSLSFTSSTEAESAKLAETFKHALPDYKIIVSEDIYKKGSYNLDIVPAGKDDAVRHVMDTYGFPRGLIAGDSENDLDALAIPQLTSIWVEDHAGPASLLSAVENL